MGYYPVFMELQGRRVLVIGGGAVGEQKVGGLLAAGADVTIVAPTLTPSLAALFAEGRVKHDEREYAEGDLEGYDLCFAATDDGAVNGRVAAEGKERRIWVNAADDPKYCDFILPSVVRQGDVVIAASTGGNSPALARRLREDLTAFLADDYEPLAEVLASVRQELRRRSIVKDGDTWQEAIDARFRALVAQRRLDEARERLMSRLGVEPAATEA